MISIPAKYPFYYIALYIFFGANMPNIFCMSQRPVFIMGHQVNDPPGVIPYLDAGANSLETDVQFNKDGTIWELYHGCPGDCDRTCDERAQLPEFLQYLRKITDPIAINSYYDQLLLLFFDLKLKPSEDKLLSGREIANAVLDHLWTSGEREQEIRIMIDIYFYKNHEFIEGFLQVFRERGQEDRLKDVGFDPGYFVSNASLIEEMFRNLEWKNVWLGDGRTNCYRDGYSAPQLRRELAIRDSGGFIKKVYDYTIDSKETMRESLDLGTDAIMTNLPQRLVEVLKEANYSSRFRPADIFDLPFEKFEEDYTEAIM